MEILGLRQLLLNTISIMTGMGNVTFVYMLSLVHVFGGERLPVQLLLLLPLDRLPLLLLLLMLLLQILRLRLMILVLLLLLLLQLLVRQCL